MVTTFFCLLQALLAGFCPRHHLTPQAEAEAAQGRPAAGGGQEAAVQCEQAGPHQVCHVLHGGVIQGAIKVEIIKN